MSVSYEYTLEVLATSPAQLSDIANRLSNPSTRLVEWAQGIEPSDCADKVAEFAAFYPTHDLVNSSHGRFRNSFRNWVGLVRSHIYKTAKEFPSAAFLLTSYSDCGSGKLVIVGDKILAESHDSNHHAQAIEWALLDIFPPFRAESQSGLPFGSLWSHWLEDMAAEIEEVRADDERWWLSVQENRRTADGDQQCPEPIDVTFNDSLPERCPIPFAPKHQTVRELRDGVWRTLCNVCHNPVPGTPVRSEPMFEDEAPSIPPTCYEVTPCNVGLHEPKEGKRPITHVERWKRRPEKIVICSECWAKLRMPQHESEIWVDYNARLQAEHEALHPWYYEALRSMVPECDVPVPKPEPKQPLWLNARKLTNYAKSFGTATSRESFLEMVYRKIACRDLEWLTKQVYISLTQPTDDAPDWRKVEGIGEALIAALCCKVTDFAELE